MVVGSNPIAVTETSGMAPDSSKELLDIQETMKCRFTLKMQTWHYNNMQLNYHFQAVLRSSYDILFYEILFC